MPKYKDIANEILHRIQTDVYPPGQIIPDQNQFAREFETSRLTVHKAIQSLINAGYLYSKRGSGTFVRQDVQITLNNAQENHVDELNSNIPSNENKLESKVLTFKVEFADKELQKKLQIQESDPVYEIERLRMRDKKVYSLEHIYMPVKIAPLTEKVLKKSIYDYLTSLKIDVGGAHRSVTAISADENDVKNLDVKLDDPVLQVEQVAFLETGVPFEYSITHYPKDTGRVVFDILLNKG